MSLRRVSAIKASSSRYSIRKNIVKIVVVVTTIFAPVAASLALAESEWEVFGRGSASWLNENSITFH